MGTVGGLVVPLVVAAAIGFVVGWFFARAGRGEDGTGRPHADDDAGEPVADDERVARLEAEYARRVEVFSKREAELIAAGRKVVEQLRQREAELAGMAGGASLVAPAVTAHATAGVATVDTPAVSVPGASDAAATADTPAVSVPGASDAAAAVETTPKRSRRAVIDPATGRPISAANGDDVVPARPSPELSVRLIAPALSSAQPPVIDLRGRRPGRPESGSATVASARSGRLIDIVGIGPKTVDQLRQAGVATLDDLARLDPDGPLPPAIEMLRGRLQRGDWVGQARRLTAG